VELSGPKDGLVEFMGPPSINRRAPLLPNLSRVASLLSYIFFVEYLRSSPFSRAFFIDFLLKTCILEVVGKHKTGKEEHRGARELKRENKR